MWSVKVEVKAQIKVKVKVRVKVEVNDEVKAKVMVLVLDSQERFLLESIKQGLHNKLFSITSRSRSLSRIRSRAK